MFRLQNHTWDVQMLGILQSLIDPGLDDFWAHLHLSVFGLEASFLGLDFGAVSFLEDSRVGLGGLRVTPAAPGQSSSELKRSVAARGRAVLAVHIFPHLLRHDRDVEEAFERTTLADGWQLEGTFPGTSAGERFVCQAIKIRHLVLCLRK